MPKKPSVYITSFLAIGIVVLAFTQRDRIKQMSIGGAKFEFGGRAASPSPIPLPSPSPCFAPRSTDHTTATQVTYTAWKPVGPDGQGGTILSYDLVAPGGASIKNASFRSCSGCGNWLWLCPEPRCPNYPTVQRVNDTHWTAWAATSGASGAVPTYEIVYTTTEQVEVPCSARPRP
jgi:hypothetical protein